MEIDVRCKDHLPAGFVTGSMVTVLLEVTPELRSGKPKETLNDNEGCGLYKSRGTASIHAVDGSSGIGSRSPVSAIRSRHAEES